MTTTKRKQDLCIENRAIIELIWELGRGTMFKVHVIGTWGFF